MTESKRLARFLYLARDLRSRVLFESLRSHCRGRVLDVGGGDFYRTALRKKITFDHWIVLEPDPGSTTSLDDDRFDFVQGDGCAMDFADASFDTVLSVQVLEHVFEPLKMIEEIHRVLKPGGSAILLVPQTANLHMAPEHYQNFTRYWLIEVARRIDAELIELKPLGGAWSTTASRFVYFFLQAFGARGMTYPEARRGPLFYVLLPFMALYALVGIPICLLLSLADLEEEANNHLAVLRKRA